MVISGYAQGGCAIRNPKIKLVSECNQTVFENSLPNLNTPEDLAKNVNYNQNNSDSQRSASCGIWLMYVQTKIKQSYMKIMENMLH